MKVTGLVVLALAASLSAGCSHESGSGPTATERPLPPNVAAPEPEMKDNAKGMIANIQNDPKMSADDKAKLIDHIKQTTGVK